MKIEVFFSFCEATSHLAQDQESVPFASQVKEEAQEIRVTEKELSKLEIKEEAKGGTNRAQKGEVREEAEACSGREEKGKKKEELVELIQEDLWTGEWVEFSTS